MRVQDSKCGEEMALGSLPFHQHIQHGKETGGKWNWGNTYPGGYPYTYNMALPTAPPPRNCPIEGCWGRAATRTVMQVQFLYRRVRDNVSIPEEGNPPHPG